MDEQSQFGIYIISDSLGEMGASVANAIRLQFPGKFPILKRFPFVEDVNELEKILVDASQSMCVVIYTFVLPELRQYTERRSVALGLHCVDILGNAMHVAEVLTGVKPIPEAGLNRRLDKEYFRKIAAIEFAVKYDDGADPSGLYRADIVLVGISRTSKTPLSMYLAYRNYKVSNIPLIPGVQPPAELFEIDKKKIIGLTNDPGRLLSIRSERLKDLGIDQSKQYANLEVIKKELQYANRIFALLDCTVLDVANRSIEESAVIILSMIGGLDNELRPNAF